MTRNLRTYPAAAAAHRGLALEGNNICSAHDDDPAILGRGQEIGVAVRLVLDGGGLVPFTGAS